VAGKVYLYASAKNLDQQTLAVAFTTPYGAKTVTGVTQGRSASASFAAGAKAIGDGAITVAASTAGGANYSATVGDEGLNCG
jgi:hypothetical protein